MAELSTAKREKLRSRQFAYVDSKGGEHLPINDESHIRNAMARWNQTDFESATAKERARRKIASAAKKHGIEASEDSNVAKPTRSLRATSTKRGPRGGRKKTS
jgi:uncharacterized membrane protein